MRGDRPAPARANWHKSSHIKKSSKHRGLYTTRPYTKKIIVYHGGISLPLYAGKVCETGHIKKAKTVEHKKRVRDSLPPLPLAAGWLPRGPAGGRFSNSGGLCCKGGYFTQCRFPLQKEKGRGTMSTTPWGLPLCFGLAAGARAFLMPPSCAWTQDAESQPPAARRAEIRLRASREPMDTSGAANLSRAASGPRLSLDASRGVAAPG